MSGYLPMKSGLESNAVHSVTCQNFVCLTMLRPRLRAIRGQGSLLEMLQDLSDFDVGSIAADCCGTLPPLKLLSCNIEVDS